MKRILVIGGAGYLGSVLCRKLLINGYRVRVLDCLMYGDKGIRDLYNNPNFEFKKGDIRDIQTVVESLKNVDGVIHLAAIVGDPASSIKPEETVEINYLATKILLWVCKYHKVKRFIFASTCSVYGSNTEELLTETSETLPLSLYSEMKLKSENEILKMDNDTFSPCILRMATLYGQSSRMRFDLVINWFIMNAIKKKEFSLFGGNQERCFCHIEDAADAYIKCLETPLDIISGEILNVSSDNLKIIELGNKIIENVPDADMIIKEKEIDNRSYSTSNKKIMNMIGWKPSMSIDDFIDYMKRHSRIWNDYESPSYNNYEYLKRIGLREI